MALGLYLHVPFCRTRCHFCAFYLRVYRASDAAAYVNALHREIDRHAAAGTLRGRSVDTVYFGGGTPTALPATDLAAVLRHITDAFDVSPGAEITVEAHPADAVDAMLGTLAAAGVTRMSFGAQSFDENELVALGRQALPSTTTRAVSAARCAGISSINLDLMYGLPGQTARDWQDSLDEACSLLPDHLSCYAFTVEDDTKTGRDIALGRGMAPEPALQVELEEATGLQLAGAGYERYEISNYARPGHRCRHNVLYWTDGEYLGLGPSAQSYLDGVRFGVEANLPAYCDAQIRGEWAIDEREWLSVRQRAIESVVFGLRLIDGVPWSIVRNEGPCDSLGIQWDAVIDRLMAEGFLERVSGRVRLTSHGRRYADTVSVQLLTAV
jgi:oxygen-independent coproporphyrinogen-3 oxidase